MASACMPVQLQGRMPCMQMDRLRNGSRGVAVQTALPIRNLESPVASCSSSLGSSYSRVSTLKHFRPSTRQLGGTLVVRSEVAVQLGGGPASEGTVTVGSRVKVIVPVKVYHIPKVPEFNLEGCEGEVKDILGIWKGKPVSANLPIKVQFVVEINGTVTKFLAHLQDHEVGLL